MQSQTRQIGLDLARTIAILCVLVCHLSGAFTNLPPRVTWPLGTLGVEIFFVLSGYLIGGILLKSVHNNGNRIDGALVRTFWMRRWMRTVPNYLLFLTFYAALNRHQSIWTLSRYVTFTQNFASPIPAFFGPSWSLSIEEWFYLTLPVLIWIFARILSRSRHAFIASILTLMLVPLFLRLVFARNHPWDEGVRKIVVFRLDSIMWGVVVACMERYATSVFLAVRRPWALALGTAGALCGFAYIIFRTPVGGDQNFPATEKDMFLFWGINASCALAMPMLSSLADFPALIRVPIDRISRWSYSLYLCHPAAILAADKLLHARSPWLAALLATTISIVVSALIYNWFEMPILRWRDKQFRRSSIVPAATAQTVP